MQITRTAIIFLIVILVVIPVMGLGCASDEIDGDKVDEFTIVVLPDTQHYSRAFPGIFIAQTEWVVNNRESMNIVFVTHEGDIVNEPTSMQQWENANSAISILDDIVPYGILPGNHDQPTELYNTYFNYSRYLDESWYGGHYGNTNDNNFELFSAGGIDFIIIHLQYNPGDAVLEWANMILKDYSNRRAIITSHAILYTDGVRDSIGERIFSALKDRGNLFLMLCGHWHGEASRVDIVNNNTVIQLLADYQERTDGGDGWLRVMKFVLNEEGIDKIYVETYSPYLDMYETDEDSQFVLDYDIPAKSTSS